MLYFSDFRGTAIWSFTEYSTTVASTWTMLASNFVYIFMCGGGSGGNSHDLGQGGGGGGGAMVINRYIQTTGNIVVTIGGKGTGAAQGSSTAGTAGGDTVLSGAISPTLIAYGGETIRGSGLMPGYGNPGGGWPIDAPLGPNGIGSGGGAQGGCGGSYKVSGGICPGYGRGGLTSNTASNLAGGGGGGSIGIGGAGGTLFTAGKAGVSSSSNQWGAGGGGGGSTGGANCGAGGNGTKGYCLIGSMDY